VELEPTEKTRAVRAACSIPSADITCSSALLGDLFLQLTRGAKTPKLARDAICFYVPKFGTCRRSLQHTLDSLLAVGRRIEL